MSAQVAIAINNLTRVITPFSEPYSGVDVGTIGCVVEGQIATAKDCSQ